MSLIDPSQSTPIHPSSEPDNYPSNNIDRHTTHDGSHHSQSGLEALSSVTSTTIVKSPKSRRRRRFHIGQVCGFCRTSRGRLASSESIYAFNQEPLTLQDESPTTRSSRESIPHSSESDDAAEGGSWIEEQIEVNSKMNTDERLGNRNQETGHKKGRRSRSRIRCTSRVDQPLSFQQEDSLLESLASPLSHVAQESNSSWLEVTAVRNGDISAVTIAQQPESDVLVPPSHETLARARPRGIQSSDALHSDSRQFPTKSYRRKTGRTHHRSSRKTDQNGNDGDDSSTTSDSHSDRCVDHPSSIQAHHTFSVPHIPLSHEDHPPTLTPSPQHPGSPHALRKHQPTQLIPSHQLTTPSSNPLILPVASPSSQPARKDDTNHATASNSTPKMLGNDTDPNLKRPSFSSSLSNETTPTSNNNSNSLSLASTPVSSNSEVYVESPAAANQFTDDSLAAATPSSSSKRSLFGFLLHSQRPSRSGGAAPSTPIAGTPVACTTSQIPVGPNVSPNYTPVNHSTPGRQPPYHANKEASGSRFFTPRKWKPKKPNDLQPNGVSSANRDGLYRSKKDSDVLSAFPLGTETTSSNGILSRVRQPSSTPPSPPSKSPRDSRAPSRSTKGTTSDSKKSRTSSSSSQTGGGYSPQPNAASALVAQVQQPQTRTQGSGRIPSIFTSLMHQAPQGREQAKPSSPQPPALPTLEGNFGPFLGPQRKDLRGRHTLVLDLDETLVHSSFVEVPNYSFIIPVEIDGITHLIYVAKRPGVDQFLQAVARNYEVVIFTASLAKYADPLMDQLDPSHHCVARLFREKCVLWNGQYVKDMSLMGRDTRKIIILDNSPNSYAFQPENAIPIESWFDDLHDDELLQLIPILDALAKVDDIPAAIKNSL